MPVNIFEPTDNGYAGRIRLFAIDEAILLVPAELSDAENTADYCIHLDDLDGPIVGFARKRTSERAGDYIALEIESPLFPRWLKPKLFRANAEAQTFRLSWRHPRSSRDWS
ncbi:DUF736 domain-containing protein [Novosphingobium sp. PY1]|uniref:DUF736 domain-containing protein n=1 Tax=Novosphingobium sp. PY1 TaxID=1882221 RepID=UPI001A8F86A9|nr:DUF736 domain-containing protein [Novosphingobium sp. PY1]GFM28080.1 uncharacterized protein PY1_contig-04-128 [Novosphingobium sp. PY1]